MVKVTKIVEKSLHPEGEESPTKDQQKSPSKTKKGGAKAAAEKPNTSNALLSKLGPLEEKKKVEKVEFSDKLGQLFGVDPSEIEEKS